MCVCVCVFVCVCVCLSLSACQVLNDLIRDDGVAYYCHTKNRMPMADVDFVLQLAKLRLACTEVSTTLSRSRSRSRARSLACALCLARSVSLSLSRARCLSLSLSIVRMHAFTSVGGCLFLEGYVLECMK